MFPWFYFALTLTLLLLHSDALSVTAGSRNVKRKVHTAIPHQNFVRPPPISILEVGLRHILGQIGLNATKAEKDSITQDISNATSKAISLHARDGPVECGPGQPCVDGSCCNSEGKCGFTPYNCQNTAATTCISNCNARAMCGKDSIYGAQKCPLNLCCSYFGYCGMSNAHCNSLTIGGNNVPCQEGYGSCQVVSAPSCAATAATASGGRKVAYYQSGNVRWRSCNRIAPLQLSTRHLTHLVFAFASIDPTTFQIVPVDPGDLALYQQFTSLKSRSLETWIAVGGYGFSDPGEPTFTTWSILCSSADGRGAFIFSLVRFMTRWGFQGVDLDWEFPGVENRGGQPADIANFVALLREMRAAFGTKYGISIALPPDFGYLQYFDVASLASYVDFFNFMSYDLHGPWEAAMLGAHVLPQNSILDIEKDLSPLWFAGVSPAKVNLGIAYYGRGFTLANPACADVGCPYVGASAPGKCTTSPGIMSNREITLALHQHRLDPKLLPDHMIKQLNWADRWIGYDDDDTIALKTTWADQHCLGGVSIWSVELDSGPGSGDDPLNVSPDATCGSSTSNFCTTSGFGDCCSSHGYCGSSPPYCATNNGCQVNFGSCTPNGFSTSVDGKCGNGITCYGRSRGHCCSKGGFCGDSSDYCSTGNRCQEDYGLCY